MYRRFANLLSSAPSKAPRTRAPSLHRHYPASTVLWAPPTPTSARPNLGRLRGSDPLASMGLPCCDAFCLYVPSPLPRRVTRNPAVVLVPDTSAFPVLESGRLSQLRFRGLLRVHSRSARRFAGPPFRGLLSERLDVLQLPEDRPPVATRLNRQLPRQDFHLQERATFARRTLTSRDSAAPPARAQAQSAYLPLLRCQYHALLEWPPSPSDITAFGIYRR